MKIEISELEEGPCGEDLVLAQLKIITRGLRDSGVAVDGAPPKAMSISFIRDEHGALTGIIARTETEEEI